MQIRMDEKGRVLFMAIISGSDRQISKEILLET